MQEQAKDCVLPNTPWDENGPQEMSQIHKKTITCA